MNALNIEIFSDLICPWCYICRRRLEAGLKILGANELPNIIWHPFELNPDMPRAGLDRKAYRSAKFGSWERSQAMDREVAEIGMTLGLEFNYDRVLITPNTRAGHRLLWWARDKAALILSNPLLPVYPGKLQCRGLGAPVEAWNEDGKPVWNEVGELVLTAPMPCMPVSFWNDPDGSRMRASYFQHYPGIWRHGDWIEISATEGQCVIYGRSDSTLNRGGVRMGTAEFYRVIEKIPEIVEALVIDTTRLQQSAVPGRLLLFVVLSSGRGCNEELRETICAHLRAELSPRYVPDAIFAVPEIPHTLNGKKLEVPVKRLLEGTPLAKAISREAVANPGSLQYFVDLAARL
jgi:acyl-CoA synthetase (AMP-forming)/AMP-acid ligase II